MNNEKASIADWQSNIVIKIDKYIVHYDIMEEHPMILAKPENIRSQIKEDERKKRNATDE